MPEKATPAAATLPNLRSAALDGGCPTPAHKPIRLAIYRGGDQHCELLPDWSSTRSHIFPRKSLSLLSHPNDIPNVLLEFWGSHRAT